MPKISAGSAAILNGEADETLLDNIRGAARRPLDVFANATRHALHDAADPRLSAGARGFSLSLKHEFPRGLAKPRQMQPYLFGAR
jgi:3-(3-hydroxy-phenyl)propionate hydroxylase